MLSGGFVHLIMFVNTAAVLSAVLAVMSHEHRNKSKPTELKKRQQTPATNLNKLKMEQR